MYYTTRNENLKVSIAHQENQNACFGYYCTVEQNRGVLLALACPPFTPKKHAHKIPAIRRFQVSNIVIKHSIIRDICASKRCDRDQIPRQRCVPTRVNDFFCRRVHVADDLTISKARSSSRQSHSATLVREPFFFNLSTVSLLQHQHRVPFNDILILLIKTINIVTTLHIST
jgi:hypothetical protein